MGEVDENVALNRWSVAYCYYSLKKKWCVKETKCTTDENYTFFTSKRDAEEYYKLRAGYLKTIAEQMEEIGLTSKWANSNRLMAGYDAIATKVYPQLSKAEKELFLESPYKGIQVFNPKADKTYDVENYKVMGEIDETTEMGRWSIGYLCATKTGHWWVVETQGNDFKLASYFGNRCETIAKYNEKVENLKTIAQKMKANRLSGRVLTNDELKNEYENLKKQISHDNSVRKEIEYQQKLDKQRSAWSEIKKLRDNSFVDYIKGHSRITNPTGQRNDFIWIKEDGDIVFQGEFGWENECYLIGSSIKAIGCCWGEIKNIIFVYCQQGIGHLMDGSHPDFDNNDRLKAGYLKMRVDIETLTESDVRMFYEEALKNKAFPDNEEKRKIAEKIDEYNKRMTEIR